MAAGILKSRQTRYAAYAGTYILVIIAVLGAVNFLANRYDKSFDTTANKQFSLSDQTVKVISKLQRDIHIKYFDATDRFPQARDLLDRYSSLSPKVHVDFIDPVKKPQQAKAAGFRRDVSILVDSGLRKEEAKSLSEEEVTGAVIRSLKSGERNVCFVSAAGEHSIDEDTPTGFSMLKQLLERDNYKSRAVTLKTSAPEAGKPVAIGQAPAAANVEIPKDCSALVAGGPQLAYPTPVVNAIKSYVEAGGHMLFMLDNTLKLGRGDPEQRSGSRSERHRRHVRRRSRNTDGASVRAARHRPAAGPRAHGVPSLPLVGDQVHGKGQRLKVIGHHRGQHRRQRNWSRRRGRPEEGQEGSAHAGGCRNLFGNARGPFHRRRHVAVGGKPGHEFPFARQPRPVHEHDQLADVG